MAKDVLGVGVVVERELRAMLDPKGAFPFGELPRTSIAERLALYWRHPATASEPTDPGDDSGFWQQNERRIQHVTVTVMAIAAWQDPHKTAHDRAALILKHISRARTAVLGAELPPGEATRIRDLLLPALGPGELGEAVLRLSEIITNKALTENGEPELDRDAKTELNVYTLLLALKFEASTTLGGRRELVEEISETLGDWLASHTANEDSINWLKAELPLAFQPLVDGSIPTPTGEFEVMGASPEDTDEGNGDMG